MPITKLPALLDYSEEAQYRPTPVLCYAADAKVAQQIANHPVYRNLYSCGKTDGSGDVVEKAVPVFHSLDEFLEWKGELENDKLARSIVEKLNSAEKKYLAEKGVAFLQK